MFFTACIYILSNSTSSDENDVDTKCRTNTLKLLCTMNPSYVKSLRSEAISRCRLPGLAIELSVSDSVEGLSYMNKICIKYSGEFEVIHIFVDLEFLCFSDG